MKHSNSLCISTTINLRMTEKRRMITNKCGTEQTQNMVESPHSHSIIIAQFDELVYFYINQMIFIPKLTMGY